MTQQPGWYAVSARRRRGDGDLDRARVSSARRSSSGATRPALPHVWEDRCPHRGMRLSMGFVRSDRIACLYHGWQYGTDGHCLYIPAHPRDPGAADDRDLAPYLPRSARPDLGSFRRSGRPNPRSLPRRPVAMSCRSAASMSTVRPRVVADRFAAAEPPPFRAERRRSVSCPARREGPLIIHTLRSSRITKLLIGAVQPIDAAAPRFILSSSATAKDYRGAGQLHFSRFAESASRQHRVRRCRCRRASRLRPDALKRRRSSWRKRLTARPSTSGTASTTSTTSAPRPRQTRLLGQDIVLRRGRGRRASSVNEMLADGATGRSDAGQGTLRLRLDDARHAAARRAPHPRDRRARPPLGEVRRGARPRLGAPDRREFPRHGALPLRPHRHPRRRAAHRGAALSSRDPPRRRRGVGDRLQVLPAAGLDGGDRKAS